MILKPNLVIKNKLAVSVLLIFIGMGIGAFNEIVEFVAVLLVPETGVGGYENTLWDLVFNSFEVLAAVLYLRIGKRI